MAEKAEPIGDQFVKNLFHPNLPISGALSRTEQLLEVNHRQLDVLKSMAHKRLVPALSSPRVSVHVNVPDMSRALQPQFRNMVEAQQRVAQSVQSLGYQGQLLLQNADSQLDLLEGVERHTRVAVVQRNEQIDIMARSLAELQGVNDGIDLMLDGIGGLSDGLSDIGNTMRTGFRNTEAAVDRLRFMLAGMMGDLSFSIRKLTLEAVETRLHLLEMMYRQSELFVWSHREQMWVQRQQLQIQQQTLWAITNPDDVAALNKWRNGEKCRQLGNLDAAVRLFCAALDINPAEPRVYLSLGLVAFNGRNYGDAAEYLRAAYSYAADVPSVRSYALFLMAKIMMFNSRFDIARELLGKAAKIDSSNLDILFEVAVCSMGLGRDSAAVNFVRTLLERDRRYIEKILMEPAFLPIMREIRKIMSGSL